jgi:hypothetical protein
LERLIVQGYKTSSSGLDLDPGVAPRDLKVEDGDLRAVRGNVHLRTTTRLGMLRLPLPPTLLECVAGVPSGLVLSVEGNPPTVTVGLGLRPLAHLFEDGLDRFQALGILGFLERSQQRAAILVSLGEK